MVKGAVKLSRVYEMGEEITVALLRENSIFGVLSFITGQRSDRFYHSVAFTPTELLSTDRAGGEIPTGERRTGHVAG